MNYISPKCVILISLMLPIHHLFVAGVSCDSISGSATYGRVKYIYLYSLSLGGTLPSSIGNFGSMTLIILDLNSIVGTIPSTISGLTSLQRLHFFGNLLTGTIPSTIRTLTSLQRLYLDRNSLVGKIPSAMSALTSLQYLSLSNNYLTMGGVTSVPLSTFSSYTLANSIYLADNCLVFDTTSPYPDRHVTATHCRRSTGKYKVLSECFAFLS